MLRVRPWGALAALASLGLLPCEPAAATDAALVRLIPPASTNVSAGERVAFSIELLVRGQFSGPTYFDLPEVAGAILMQVDSSPSLGTRRIGGETYVSQTRDFVVYPEREGNLTVPPITARFASKEHFDQPAVEHRMRSEPFSIRAEAPPGAAPGAVIVSTMDLEATETWSPRPSGVKVGDAFTRTITVRAQDVPGMLLPAPNVGRVDGFAVYPKPPQIKDETGRGEFTGQRIDAVTYVCERPGTFQIPQLAFRWWDTKTQRWRTERFAAVTIAVAANPELVRDGATAAAFVGSSARRKWIWSIVAVLVAAAGLVALAAPHLVRRWQAWRERRAATEAAQWRRLQSAARGADAAQVYRELDRWLAHFGMSTPDLTVGPSEGVSERLRAACLGLQRRLAGIDADWDIASVAAESSSLRRFLLSTAGPGSASTLPPLNPTRSSVPILQLPR